MNYVVVNVLRNDNSNINSFGFALENVHVSRMDVINISIIWNLRFFQFTLSEWSEIKFKICCGQKKYKLYKTLLNFWAQLTHTRAVLKLPALTKKAQKIHCIAGKYFTTTAFIQVSKEKIIRESWIWRIGADSYRVESSSDSDLSKESIVSHNGNQYFQF